MGTLKRRYILAIVLLAVVGPLAVFLQFNVPPAADLGLLADRVPRRIGEWRATGDHEPDPLEVRILETKAILTRDFAKPGHPSVALSLTYAPNNRRVAHPPEICYKGGGWNVEQSEVLTLKVNGQDFRVNRLLLLQGPARLLVLYWYKAGPHCYASYVRMQWGTIWGQITMRSRSSALIRVTAMSPSAESDAAVYDTLREFAALAIPPVTDAVP